MGHQADLLPGTLDLLILKAVSLGPQHGYGVLVRIGQILEWRPRHRAWRAQSRTPAARTPGAARRRVGTSDNRRAKFYQFTAGGRRRLARGSEGWNRLVAAMGAALKTRPEEVRHVAPHHRAPAIAPATAPRRTGFRRRDSLYVETRGRNGSGRRQRRRRATPRAREFGPLGRVKEDCRDARFGRLLRELAAEVRSAWRQTPRDRGLNPWRQGLGNLAHRA
jgi:PadR family transcriptional regulator PadR